MGNEGSSKQRLLREWKHLEAKDCKVVIEEIAGDVHEILGQRHASVALFILLLVRTPLCIAAVAVVSANTRGELVLPPP